MRFISKKKVFFFSEINIIQGNKMKINSNKSLHLNSYKNQNLRKKSERLFFILK